VLSLPSNDFRTKGRDGHQAEQKAKRCSFFIKKAMTELKKSFNETEKLIIASSRKELTPLVIALLGYSQEKIDFVDPEKPAEHMVFAQEPASEDPFLAVKFKLHRLLELFKPRTEANKDLVFYASDVVFTADGLFYHKPSRDNEVNVEALVAELTTRYQKPFSAGWQIAFGAADIDGVSMGNIKLEADYPGLNPNEIIDNLNLEANTGLNLVELGVEKNLVFKLYLEDGGEPLILNDEAGYELVKQFVVQKLPTLEMFAHLIQREVVAQPERYGLLVQSFISLQRYAVEWQLDRLWEIYPDVSQGTDLAFMS